EGLRASARRVHAHARRLAAGLGDITVHQEFFDTVLARVPGEAATVVKRARASGIDVRLVDADHVGVSCDETTTDKHVNTVLAAFDKSADPDSTVVEGPASIENRTTEFLTHPVFTRYRTETAMLRYLRELADQDIALDRSMIPLGSCTMKLNSATEMTPITWPEFARLHPAAPPENSTGLRELIADVEHWLLALTGYDSISLQPNAGSQGEYAGLLAIRRYHADRGDSRREMCVIPASAHGTNAASAAMAGLRVKVVGTRPNGDVDLDELRNIIAEHGPELACVMITYPSTHGVFEQEVADLCALVHDAGGQVYVDGANLNALVGWARPGRFGGDVSHVNLHKTFCIPHGGGGPGIGPVAVRAHLARYLPGDPQHLSSGAVSAARYGSASILPITWAYIRMMGAAGLRRATAVAIAAANYVARRLEAHYPVLYTGAGGMVAHECILDLRPLTKRTGVTVEDVAKRLADYGFHAPTMSFPVPGTLMVEPTESENLAELDDFIEAMIAIRAEIEKVATGVWPMEDNPLRGAPHTAACLVDDWPHPYTRETAVYPRGRHHPRPKVWPPVRRIEAAFGDRNLACTCPPPTAYED
ncbi:MAG: aminomethyl-transferring glycine dehydrogenase, partial [Mycobacterium sp.]|nr:aminomethyl-transferring glycine dehydrogenase [Mycobacterium sp.]